MTQLKSIAKMVEELKIIKVEDVMKSEVLTVYEGWSIRRLSQFFQKHRISGAPVIASDDELVGIVTQSDVIRFETHRPDEETVKHIVERFCGNVNRELGRSEIERIRDQALDYMIVNDIMTRTPITVDVNETLEEAYLLLKESEVHRLLVVRNGILVGILTAMDILEALHKKT